MLICIVRIILNTFCPARKSDPDTAFQCLEHGERDQCLQQQSRHRKHKALFQSSFHISQHNMLVDDVGIPFLLIPCVYQHYWNSKLLGTGFTTMVLWGRITYRLNWNIVICMSWKHVSDISLQNNQWWFYFFILGRIVMPHLVNTQSLYYKEPMMIFTWHLHASIAAEFMNVLSGAHC